jgi:lipopolysaccharide export system permease protein
MALFLSLITFTLSENVLPYSKIKYDEVRRKIQKLKPQTMEQHGRQFLFGQPRSDDLSRIYYFYQYNEKDQAFSKISYYDYDPINMRLVKRLSSEGAIWDQEFKGWEFHNGWIQIFNYPGISTEQFVSRIIKLEEEPEYFKRSWHTPDQMSYAELKDLISELRLKGYDPVYEQVQLFWKLAYAVVTLIVVLLGLPFSFSFTNKGSLAGIFISLVIVVIYYPLSNVFKHLGYSAVLPPLMAAWGVNLLFILIALVMFVRMRT